MDLSIIIVNYNVKYFLHQLIQSLLRSNAKYQFEIIVVDNASQDDSIAYLQNQSYRDRITLLANETNVGFSKANNQGIKIAQGRYILLLNPDTLVQEDTLTKVIDCMDEDAQIGALGVKMIDGSSQYLPESKRGFPTPWVSFCRIFGLADLFPKSRIFNGYYMGHLSEFETQDVDILTGAFLLVRREVVDKIGGLDEAFFMYGEDIDFSYRVKQAGYDVVYFPHTSIIHFKGESTNKDSVRYVRNFYGAMQIFSRKHFSGSRAGISSIILGLAIHLKAVFTHLNRWLSKILYPLIDAAVIFGLLTLFSNLWATYYYHNSLYFEEAPLHRNIFTYIVIWLVTMLLHGAYDRPYRGVLRGALFGWLVVIAVYGFFPEFYRSSRALVFLGGALVVGGLILMRFVAGWLSRRRTRKPGRIGVVGSLSELRRLAPLIAEVKKKNLVGRIHIEGSSEDSASLGALSELDQIVRYHDISELIFCLRDISSQQIMRWMTHLGTHIEYKMAPEESMSIVGSKSKDEQGIQHTVGVRFNIEEPHLRRNKRLLDVTMALLVFVFSPILAVAGNHLGNLLRNCWLVAVGKRTWVGYRGDNEDRILPYLPDSVLTTVATSRQTNPASLADADFFYARDYKPWKDIERIFASLKHLDSQ